MEPVKPPEDKELAALLILAIIMLAIVLAFALLSTTGGF